MGDVILTIDQADKHVDAPNISMEQTTAQADADTCFAAVEAKLSMLSQDTLSYGSICIYKVPENYRNQNQQAYTPRLVSVGFIHHGDNRVQPMEEYKIRYLNNFLHIFRVSLKELVKYVSDQQYLVCRCYEDTYIRSLPEGKVPSEMILFDGVFVVELFLKNYFVELREKGDIIFDNIWVYNEILHDMLLFENQLPLGFIRSLYDKFVLQKVGKWLDNCAARPPPFTELAHKYFKDVGTRKVSLNRNFSPARHFLEFLSILHRPDGKENPIHQVGSGVNFAECPSATELKAAGVKFRKGSNCVHFDPKTGVLSIPPLTVNDSTETYYRNVISFEQSGYHSKYTTSMVIFLDNLVDTTKDVDLLIHDGIIKNELGSSDQVAELFNSIYKEFMPDPKEFYFVKECKELNEYSRDRWHKIKASTFKQFAVLKRDYFTNPWTIISLIAAIIALALTAIQTVYSVKSS